MTARPQRQTGQHTDPQVRPTDLTAPRTEVSDQLPASQVSPVVLADRIQGRRSMANSIVVLLLVALAVYFAYGLWGDSQPSDEQLVEYFEKQSNAKAVADHIQQLAANKSQVLNLQSGLRRLSRKITEVEQLSSDWDKRLLELLDGEEGKRIAARKQSLETFDTIRAEIDKLQPLLLDNLRDRVAVLSQPMSDAIANDQFYELDAEFNAEVNNVQQQVTDLLDKYRLAHAKVESLAGAPGADNRAGRTLQGALDDLQRERYEAQLRVIQAEREEARRQAAKELAAAERAKIEAEARVKKQEIDAARLKADQLAASKEREMQRDRERETARTFIQQGHAYVAGPVPSEAFADPRHSGWFEAKRKRPYAVWSKGYVDMLIKQRLEIGARGELLLHLWLTEGGHAPARLGSTEWEREFRQLASGITAVFRHYPQAFVDLAEVPSLGRKPPTNTGKYLREEVWYDLERQYGREVIARYGFRL